jgi:PAS domain S-box-containing protein
LLSRCPCDDFSASQQEKYMQQDLTAIPVPTKQQFSSEKYAEQQIRNLFLHAPIAIQILKGPDFVYELANKRSLEILGKKEEEIMGRNVLEVMPELKEQHPYKVLQDVYSTGERLVVEEEKVRYLRNGELVEIFAKLVYEPLRDEQGKVIGIMITGDDITQQVLARMKIEESEEKYRKLSETLEQKIHQRTAELVELNKTLEIKNLDLEDTQNFLQQLIDASVEFILVLDTNLHYITVNKKYEQAMGVTRDEVRQKHLFDFSPKVKGTAQHEAILRALAGETVNLDKRQAVSRTDYFVDSYFIPLVLKGKIEGVMIMSRDVTDIVKSEKILEDKIEELNEAQQIAQLGSWDWDVGANEVQWSEQMYGMYGYGKERFRVTFERAVERMVPEDAERSRARMREHILESQALFKQNGIREFNISPIEYSIVLPDGSTKALRASGKIILTDEGNISRLIGTVQDITWEKLSQEQLREANRKLDERNQFVEKLINSSLDAIMVVDKELHFLTINRKAESVIGGHYAGNLIGKKITEVYSPLQGTQQHEDLLQAFQGNIIIRDKAKSPESEYYYEHNYIPLSDAAGEVYAVMIISHDITESIRQMEELTKAIEADKLKSDFIKMASHELKTPITSIKGYVQLLLTALKETEEQEKKLSPLLLRSSLISTEKQLNRLTRLMSELLDLSRIESGQLALNLEEFNINELVIDVIQDVLHTKPPQQVNLYHDINCRVHADKDRIGQVVINVLTNAIKYSPGEDKIDVTIRRHETGQVAVSITDYGIGIEQKFHEKIFDRFYRAEGHEEQTYPGFGIGLFIAKEIIQRHGGSIYVTSEKRKGSTFTFTLPMAKKHKA